MSNEITNKSNFISFIGNDPIIIYGSKNCWISKVSAPQPGINKGPPTIGHASDLTSPLPRLACQLREEVEDWSKQPGKPPAGGSERTEKW